MQKYKNQSQSSALRLQKFRKAYDFIVYLSYVEKTRMSFLNDFKQDISVRREFL